MINFTNILLKINNNHTYIGYHGTKHKFNKFNLNLATQRIIWFSSSFEKVKSGDVGAQSRGYIAKAELTIKNPANWDQYEKKSLWELQIEGYDGAILPDDDETTYFVFSPQQIKILEWIKVD